MKIGKWNSLALLPLVLLAFGCFGQPGVAGNAPTDQSKEITLKTQDGWEIVGDLYTPKGGSKGVVILLHQRGGQASDWTPLCHMLSKAGFTALALDQRGAGRSVRGPGPTGEDAPWETGGDVAAAIAYLKEKRVGLVGASYGANNALIYAAAHPDQVKGIALLSPGSNYHGLNALAAAPGYHGAVSIYHDRDDGIAGDGPQQIQKLLPGKDHALHLYSGSAHGTGLLDANVDEEIVHFIQKTLR